MQVIIGEKRKASKYLEANSHFIKELPKSCLECKVTLWLFVSFHLPLTYNYGAVLYVYKQEVGRNLSFTVVYRSG